MPEDGSKSVMPFKVSGEINEVSGGIKEVSGGIKQSAPKQPKQ
jgi:hypothetical protein